MFVIYSIVYEQIQSPLKKKVGGLQVRQFVELQVLHFRGQLTQVLLLIY